MLHYSNASSIEKNRRYLVIKGGGLPGCLDKEWSSTPLPSVIKAIPCLVSLLTEVLDFLPEQAVNTAAIDRVAAPAATNFL